MYRALGFTSIQYRFWYRGRGWYIYRALIHQAFAFVRIVHWAHRCLSSYLDKFLTELRSTPLGKLA